MNKMKSTMVLPSQYTQDKTKPKLWDQLFLEFIDFQIFKLFFPLSFFPPKKKVISPHSYSTEAEEVLSGYKATSSFSTEVAEYRRTIKITNFENANEIKKTTSMSLLKRTSLSIQRYLCKVKKRSLTLNPPENEQRIL